MQQNKNEHSLEARYEEQKKNSGDPQIDAAKCIGWGIFLGLKEVADAIRHAGKHRLLPGRFTDL